MLDEQRCEGLLWKPCPLDVLRRKVDAADVYDTISMPTSATLPEASDPPDAAAGAAQAFLLAEAPADGDGGGYSRGWHSGKRGCFCQNVCLDFRDRDLVLSDNYFDLTAPEAYTVTAQTQASAAELLPQLTVKTVYDIR